LLAHLKPLYIDMIGGMILVYHLYTMLKARWMCWWK
jgi:hypothetical protein